MGWEGVGEQGIFQDVDARAVLVHQEQGIAAFSRFRLHEEKVGQIAGSDKPLFTVYQIAVIGACGAAVNHFVGAGFGLGNRIGLPASALQQRCYISLQLVFTAGTGLVHPRLRLGKTPTQGISGSAQGLPSHHLVHHTQSHAAMRCGCIHAGQTQRQRLVLDVAHDRGWQFSAIELSLYLPGYQRGIHVMTHGLLPGARRVVELDLHGVRAPVGCVSERHWPGSGAPPPPLSCGAGDAVLPVS